MGFDTFDEHAPRYDAWFLANRNVLGSELELVRRALGQPGQTLSVGCGSGLFELLLAQRHGVHIRTGVEPSESMARIAEVRGLVVIRGRAEELPADSQAFDTLLMNGTPGYVADLGRCFRECFRALRPGGRLVVCDVPAESAYALLYRLAVALGSWENPMFAGVAPRTPYPVEFAAGAHWRTTPEKVALLEQAGFRDLSFLQTLTRHPAYTDDLVEEPIEGFDRGGYVAITAVRPL
jgi:SAM-dependent methyltransferase